MNLESKQTEVNALHQKFQGAQAAILVDFKGCSCEELSEVRGELKNIGAELKIVKNTLAKRAVEELAIQGFAQKLTGPTAVVWAEDPPSAAKVVAKFSKELESFEIKGGFVEKSLVEEADVVALSNLPSKEALQAQLLALINAPATQ